MSKLLVNWVSYFVSSPTTGNSRDVANDGVVANSTVNGSDGAHQVAADADDSKAPLKAVPRSFSGLIESSAKVVWGGSWAGGKLESVHPSEQAMSFLVQYLVRNIANTDRRSPNLLSGLSNSSDRKSGGFSSLGSFGNDGGADEQAGSYDEALAAAATASGSLRSPSLSLSTAMSPPPISTPGSTTHSYHQENGEERHAAELKRRATPGRQLISESCARLIAEFICEREEVAVLSSESAMPISCSPNGLHACDDAIPTGTVGEGGGPSRCITASNSTVYIGSGEGVAQYDAALTERKGLLGTGHVVVAVAVSEDGTCCATGGTDGCVSLWSTVFAEQPLFFEGHSDWVTFVAFATIGVESDDSTPSPSSTTVASKNPAASKKSSSAPKRRQVVISGSDDGTVIMWGLQGEILSVLEYSLGIGIRAMCVAQLPYPSSGGGDPFHTTSIALAAEKPSIHLFTVSKTCSIRAAGVIYDAHAGTLTSIVHVTSMNWVVSSGEDEVVTVSSLETMLPLYRCKAFVSKRRCVSFMNTVASIVVVAQPPESSVVVLVACASDGGVLQWIIDPRDQRHRYCKTLKLHIGNLISMTKMILPI